MNSPTSVLGPIAISGLIFPVDHILLSNSTGLYPPVDKIRTKLFNSKVLTI